MSVNRHGVSDAIGISADSPALPVREIHPQSGSSTRDFMIDVAKRAARPGNVEDIPVQVEVVIGRMKISVAKLMAASKGQCFSLDTHFGEPVELQVNGRTIGFAELVADDADNLIGVRMLSINTES